MANRSSLADLRGGGILKRARDRKRLAGARYFVGTGQLELFEPVLDQVIGQFRCAGGLALLEHQESLAVPSHVIVVTAGIEIPVLEQLLVRPSRERRLGAMGTAIIARSLSRR